MSRRSLSAILLALVALLLLVAVWRLLLVAPVLVAAWHARMRRRRIRRFRRASLPEWVQAASVAAIAIRSTKR